MPIVALFALFGGLFIGLLTTFLLIKDSYPWYRKIFLWEQKRGKLDPYRQTEVPVSEMIYSIDRLDPSDLDWLQDAINVRRAQFRKK